MTDFDINEYRSMLRLETDARLNFLLGEVGRNGESKWTMDCEQAIKDELEQRKEEAKQPSFL